MSRLAKAWPAAALVALTLATYAPVRHAGFVWDDDFYLADNPTLADLAGLKRIWLDTSSNPQYYPLVFTSFWIERHLWGLEPSGYHLVNVGLHAASAVLLWRILLLLAVPGAWLAAALFAIHPVQVESVAWVTERKNVLSGIFFLGAGLCYLRCALARAEPAQRKALGVDRSGKARAVAAAVLFVCALLSKSVTAVLPIALGIVLVWKRGRLDGRDVGWLGGMLALGALAGLRTAWLEVHQVGAQGETFDLSLLERCLVAGRAFWFYLGKLFWPANLSFVYPKWRVEAGQALPYAFPLAAAALLGGLYALRGRLGGGPLAAFLYFGVALGPALGFLNVYPMRYSFVADHFQYLASIGPLSLAAAAGALAGRKVGAAYASRGTSAGGVAAWVARGIAGLVLVAIGMLSWRQAHAYRDIETLWRATIRANPRATLAHWNLGKHLENRGDLDEAIAHYRAALGVEPGIADVLVNLGNALMRKGRVEEARAAFEEAARLHPRHPIARYNLGVALEREGQTDRAMSEYLEALRNAPDPLASRSDLEEQLYRKGSFGQLYSAAHSRLADLLARQGRSDEAAEHERLATVSDGSSPAALVDLANRKAEEGRLAEAIALYRKVLEASPEHALAHYNLALAYEQQSDLGRALAEYREAIRYAPDLGAAHKNLAIVLFKTGDYGGAWTEVHLARRNGVEPHPDFVDALSAKLPPP